MFYGYRLHHSFLLNSSLVDVRKWQPIFFQNFRINFSSSHPSVPSLLGLIHKLVNAHATTCFALFCRRPDQYYVWWTMESPATMSEVYKKSLKEFDNVFNLTMTYRSAMLDSDISQQYAIASTCLYVHCCFPKKHNKRALSCFLRFTPSYF